MAKYRLKFVSKEHYDRAWEDIERWEYPWKREEYGQMTMLEMGDSVAWIWFEWYSPEIAVVHLCADPKYRGKCFNRHNIEAMKWAASLLGAHTIYTISKNEDIVSYVSRLGWQQDEAGWYTDV